MYPDVVTWNGMYGICSQGCTYCYNRLHWNKWGKMRLNERTLKENLGSGKFIFVGSSCDMFADDVPSKWIYRVLEHCGKFNNRYLFQTKNPSRLFFFLDQHAFPEDCVLGITLESNRNYPEISKAPSQKERLRLMIYYTYHQKMISIEPILDFDLNEFVRFIRDIAPEYVSIGANTNRSVKLPEPSPKKVNALIEELKKFTKVKVKDNLKRLMEAKNG